jgi:tetratricopeptide (TPR) repeat protein
MLQLLDRARRGGDWRELDQLADRLFELEELSEQGVRAKMEAAALAGDRLGALKLYERWMSRLQAELSASPSPVMHRFAEDLRRGGHVVGNLHPPRGTSTTLTPLVARSEEFGSIYRVWERVLERSAGHALIRGERGVGKTTLASHFLAAVALDGAAVSRAKCFELEQDIPYAAVSTLLRGLMEQPGAAATSPEALADLALIVPSLRERYTGLPESYPAQGESARLRLTEAAFQLIVAVAEERPVVLAVDDFHLADDASLAVLHLVMRRLEDERVMILLVGRGREATRSPNAGRLLDAVTNLGIGIIDVPPLGHEASDEVLSVLLGGARPHPATRRAILHAARGYPLALALLAHSWLESSAHTGALLLEGMTPDIALTTPDTLFAPLLARVNQRLEASSRPVLDLAAVLGSRMNDLRFYSMLGLSSAQTIAALDVLADQGVLHEGGAGLEFVNDIARTQVYLQQPAAIRRQMHALVADELLLREREAGAVSGLELAWHLIRCGRLTEGIAYLLRGAREAIDHGAAWEAERALRSGADTLQGEEAIAARLLLAESLLEQGREGETREMVGIADATGLAWARDVGNAISIAAMARRPEQPVEQALDAFHCLTGIMREGYNDRARAVAARGAALFALKLGSQRVADELLHATDSIADTGLSPIDIADLRYARATALYQLRRLEESESEATQAVTTLERANLRNATLLSLYCGLGAIRCARGEYHDAVPLLERAHDIAHKIGNLTTARACLSNLSLCCFRMGDTYGHIRWGEMASRRHPETTDTFAETTYTYHLAIGYALSGEAHKAFDALAVGDAAAGRLAPAWARQSWLLSRADVLSILGRQQDAVRAAREAVSAEFNALLSDSRAGAYARWRAKLVRNPEEARSARAEVLGLLGRGERFDATDRAEILAAAKLLGQLTNDDVTSEGQALQQALSQLPAAVGALLRQFGFLEVVKPLGAARMTRRRKRSGARPGEDLAARQGQNPSQPE